MPALLTQSDTYTVHGWNADLADYARDDEIAKSVRFGAAQGAAKEGALGDRSNLVQCRLAATYGLRPRRPSTSIRYQTPKRFVRISRASRSISMGFSMQRLRILIHPPFIGARLR